LTFIQLSLDLLKELPMTTRRHFMSQTAVAASVMSFPLIAGAQAKAIKVGVLHPVTGALAYSGQQCRMGALMAIEDINKAGGIKSLGGAKIEALLGDAQSSPQAGAAEIEKMNEAGVSAVVGAFASAICALASEIFVASGEAVAFSSIITNSALNLL
jgi:branched-chain amino acid transport system substrate-binding protein